ncbi:MAG: hypothetical protein ACI865_003075 [Flavobacteriaceae bacterium]|jgi:hypothetical protein
MKFTLIAILALILVSSCDPQGNSDSNWSYASQYDVEDAWETLNDSLVTNDSIVDLTETDGYFFILDEYEMFKKFLATEEDKDNPHFRQAMEFARSYLDSIQELQKEINNQYRVQSKI